MLRKYNLVVTVLFAALVFINVRQCEEKNLAENALEASHADVTYWKDQAGRSNAEVQILKLDKDLLEKTNLGLKDSLEELGIKLKNAKRVVTITKHTTDTVEVSRPRFSSTWLDYEWIDSTKLALTVRDSLALITHNKKYGFLNLKTKYVTRAISYNPHTTLTGVTSIEIVPKDKIGFGFYGGYGLTLSGGIVRAGPQAGFGIHIRL